MTQYYPLNTRQAALAMSEDSWNKVLGRLKLPGDTTRFLCSVLSHPTDGTALVIVEDTDYSMLYPKLNQSEKNNFDNNVLQANDPYVVAFLAAVEAAKPSMPV